LDPVTQTVSPADLKVLVVDDDHDVRSFFADFLSREGYKVDTARCGTAALESLARNNPDVLLLDLKLPDISGLQVLKRMNEMKSSAAVIMMTGFGTLQSAVQAMKNGASDYLVKPIEDLGQLSEAVKRAAVSRAVSLPPVRGTKTVGADGRPLAPYPVGDSPQMKHVLELANRAAAVDSSVLICGESGTGKELIAKLIHYNCPRGRGKFLAVNCGALPDSLLESALFGYEKGAFTGAYKRTKGYFEAADGGTLFLDEIADTSIALQAKLLRALEEKAFQRVGGVETVETDVRIIAATNKNMEQEVASGRFRQDLFYRINVLRIDIPPLRERPEDIPALVKHFLRLHTQRMRRQTKGFTPEAMARLMAYSWPGNVRELENVVERALAFMGDDATLDVASLPPHVAAYRPERAHLPLGLRSLAKAREQFERDYISQLLREAGGNVTVAARMAGIARQNLYVKMRKYGLHPRPK
jgi:DNA-binding NtrC family response regulator